MKTKYSVVFLTAVLISAVFCGCGGEKGSSSVSRSSTVPEIVETTADNETSTSSQTDSTSKFDFEKAVASTYICGKQLSYPVTWEQLSEDFSVDGEAEYVSFNYMYCYLNYKGQYLGVITFKDCQSVSEISADTKVASISISDSKMDAFDVVPISINGVTFHDTHEALYAALGDDCEINEDTGAVKYSDVVRDFCFSFSRDDRDKISGIDINFC